MNNFKRTMLNELISQIIRINLIIVVVFVISYFLGLIYVKSQTWSEQNPVYYFFKFIEQYYLSIALIICLTSTVIIVIRSWLKAINNFNMVLVATENIYDSKTALIELPLELKDVQNQMNNIKLSVAQNKQAAKEAEQRKNDLVVYLAHDLKTPLTSVIGYLTLLRDEGEISPELREKYLTISLDKAERLEDLINEFFEITRFNLSTLTLEPSKINLSRMLEQLVFEFKPMFYDKNLTCSVDVDKEIVVNWDVDKMQRVLDNLLRNAVNYSFDNSEIEINVTSTKNKIKLFFKNSGNTIPEEKLSRIFEQFYRLDTARITRSGGAGLGLAIAKQIVELHGGSISASSKEEVILFEIEIPTL